MLPKNCFFVVEIVEILEIFWRDPSKNVKIPVEITRTPGAITASIPTEILADIKPKKNLWRNHER